MLHTVSVSNQFCIVNNWCAFVCIRSLFYLDSVQVIGLLYWDINSCCYLRNIFILMWNLEPIIKQMTILNKRIWVYEYNFLHFSEHNSLYSAQEMSKFLSVLFLKVHEQELLLSIYTTEFLC